MRPVTRRRWIDPLVAVLLILVLSGCWSAVMSASPLDNSSDPVPSPPDEEREKQESESEGEAQVVRVRVRPPEPPQAAVATAPKQKPVTYPASTRLASVAPKSHPSRFSVRRLQ